MKNVEKTHFSKTHFDQKKVICAAILEKKWTKKNAFRWKMSIFVHFLEGTIYSSWYLCEKFVFFGQSRPRWHNLSVRLGAATWQFFCKKNTSFTHIFHLGTWPSRYYRHLKLIFVEIWDNQNTLNDVFRVFWFPKSQIRCSLNISDNQLFKFEWKQESPSKRRIKLLETFKHNFWRIDKYQKMRWFSRARTKKSFKTQKKCPIVI